MWRRCTSIGNGRVNEKEPADDQLTNILYKYLAQHAEVDEVCFGALLAELVHDHPLRRMMEE
jgi:hypothetical protein